MKFASREDAGRRLGQYLIEQAVEVDVVVGLPRGGVVVAAEVARALQCPLDVLVVRKIGHPWHREFAVGALAENEVIILEDGNLGFDLPARDKLRAIIDEENERLHAAERKFHFDIHSGSNGKRVLLIDDGLATGSTAQAGVLSARKQGALAVTVAAPVASIDAVERLRRAADAVNVLFTDPAFEAVGSYYEEFRQTTDEEVIALLATPRITG